MIPNNLWERACKQILETEDRFPTIARMKSVLQEVSRNFQPEEDISKVYCERCEGTGFISTAKSCGTWRGYTLWNDYSFRCTCANGAYLSKLIPIWNEKWRNKGYLLREEWKDAFDKERKHCPQQMVNQIGKKI